MNYRLKTSTNLNLHFTTGRGRADNSRFYILASEEKCVAEREWTISLKEPMMREAMETIQEEIVVNNVTFQRKKQELQRLAKRRREVVASNQGARETSQGHCVIRYYNYYLIFQPIFISS